MEDLTWIHFNGLVQTSTILLAICCEEIPLALKNRPNIYGMYLQSVPESWPLAYGRYIIFLSLMDAERREIPPGKMDFL